MKKLFYILSLFVSLASIVMLGLLAYLNYAMSIVAGRPLSIIGLLLFLIPMIPIALLIYGWQLDKKKKLSGLFLAWAILINVVLGLFIILYDFIFIGGLVRANRY